MKKITISVFILCFVINSFGEDRADLGVNSEAQDFAKSMTELAKATWPKGKVVWHLELSPKIVKDDIVAYRKSVKYCKATISVSEEWFKITETEQRNFIKTSLDVLHKPSAFPSKTLDYYPNSSGELSMLVGDKVVATGKYSNTKTDISLKPRTYKKDTKAKYSAKISILNKDGLIQFQGVTNLQNSESILFTISKGSYSAQSKAVVQNGSFLTETFSNKGNPLSPGTYSLHLNVFNPKTSLMIEAKGTIILPQTKVIELTFNPTIL